MKPSQEFGNGNLAILQSVLSKAKLLNCPITKLPNPSLPRFPSLQFRDPSREKASHEAGKSHLFHLALHAFLHLRGGQIGQGKPSSLVTMGAIHRALRSVGFSTPALLIPRKRHSARLAILE
jgi:hypothetical protein